MSLMSTLGVDAGGGADGNWGTGTVYAESEKAGLADMTGDAWYHSWRGDCSRESGWDVMMVGIGRLQCSWIWRITACSLRSPLTAASPPTKGTVGRGPAHLNLNFKKYRLFVRLKFYH